MGHGRAPHKSIRARKKKYIKEEPSNVSEEAQQNVVIEDENVTKCGELVKALTMCCTKSETSIEKLPDELLTNIFTRIKAKQLSRMRKVCKPWKSLLSESSFIKAHLHHSLHNNINQKLLMAFNYSVCPCDSTPHTTLHPPSPHPQLTKRLPPVNPWSTFFTTANLKVIGAVHGLMCSSSIDSSVIQIRNLSLSLSASSTLPPSPTPSHRFCKDFTRFGFDPQTEDYKVVKITGKIDTMNSLSTAEGYVKYPFSIKKWMPVEVYSMRKGAWELIASRVPPHFKVLEGSDRLCVDGHDGHLHWLACSVKGGKTDFDIIATFDLSSHTFGQIRLPDSSTLKHRDIDVVGVLEGKLCVLLWGVQGAHEVWVMEDSWVKRHAFSLSPAVYPLPPLGFTYHNQLLMKHDHGYLVLYDPSAKKTKYFNPFCCRHRAHPDKVVEKVDSLVWVVPAQPPLTRSQK